MFKTPFRFKNRKNRASPKLGMSFHGVSCKVGEDGQIAVWSPKLYRIGPTNFSVSTIWPGSYESSLTPYFHPIQATEPISKSTDSIYSFAGISWTSNGP
ncbi:hypothetical protein LINPERPRIM_LOCUS33269, partial [Linum perenne]